MKIVGSMTEDYPLISVIMPTRNRLQFLEQAIKLFQAQDYPNKELVIVDSSDEPTTLPDSPDIRYVYISEPLTLGMMRNVAVSISEGDIIAHMDDDDVFGPQRLSKQIAPILRGDADVTGMYMSLLLDANTSTLYRCPEEMHKKLFPSGVRCGTLMYYAQYWYWLNIYYNGTLTLGEDWNYLHQLQKAKARLVQVVDPASYICVRHGSNTSDGLDTSDWEQVPLEYYLSGDDRAFYASLRSEVSV